MTESVNWPSGLPIAITSWPTWRLADVPTGIVGNPVPSILTTARSWAWSLDATRPGNSRPSLSVTVSVPLPSIT